MIVGKEGKGCGSRRWRGKESMCQLERKERDVVVGDGGERKVCDSSKGRKGMW